MNGLDAALNFVPRFLISHSRHICGVDGDASAELALAGERVVSCMARHQTMHIEMEVPRRASARYGHVDVHASSNRWCHVCFPAGPRIPAKQWTDEASFN